MQSALGAEGVGGSNPLTQPKISNSYGRFESRTKIAIRHFGAVISFLRFNRAFMAGYFPAMTQQHSTRKVIKRRDSLFVRHLRCSRFCDGCASKDHHVSLNFNRQPAIGTLQITWDHRISPDFTKDWNLVRDQRVGPKVLWHRYLCVSEHLVTC